MTRVLAVIGSFGMGGAENYVRRVVPKVRDLGVEVELCVLDPTGPLAEPIRNSGITIHATDFGRWTSRANTRLLLGVANEIGRVLRQGRFDVMHSYLFWSDVFGTLGGRLAPGTRLIISRQAMAGWRHTNTRHERWLEGAANLLATELIANSRTLLRETERLEHFVPRRRGVVYAGVEVKGYRPARPRREGLLRLVSVGALNPRKGHDIGLEALAAARAEGVVAHLTIVGGGAQEAELRERAARLGLSEVVSFAGLQQDPRPFLAEADLFWFPSRQEGFASALLEAMATALPVITTDVGGNAEAVVDAEGGLVVPPLDPGALARALVELAGDRNRLVAMGEANRERVELLFSLDASAQRLARWYTEGPIVEPGLAPGIPGGPGAT